MSSVTHALNIVELVEATLLYTTTYEIQVATNVNAFFRTIVENSRALKLRINDSKQSEKGALLQKQGQWHSCVSTVDGKKTLFVLRNPASKFITFLLSDDENPYLQVLDADYDSRLDKSYKGRTNTEFWEDSDDGIRQVLRASKRDREIIFGRYIYKFY